MCAQALLVLPRQFPIDLEDLNWAPITAGVVVVAALAAWYFPVWRMGACAGDKAHAAHDPSMVRTLVPIIGHIASTASLLTCSIW